MDDPLAELLHQMQASWKRDAACREHPDLSWFPERGADQSRQRAIRASCLVRVECYAAGEGERGIWGGASGRARKQQIRLKAA